MRTNFLIYGCESVKSDHQKHLLRIVMSKNKHKNKQEDQEKANIYKVITNSCYQKRKYTGDKDFNAYQKVLRIVAHY